MDTMKLNWIYSKNDKQQIEQVVHRMTTQGREKIQRMTMQKVTEWLHKGGNHLEQDSIRSTTSIDGGLHSAAEGPVFPIRINWKGPWDPLLKF